MMNLRLQKPIVSKRLILRRPKPRDLKAYHEFLNRDSMDVVKNWYRYDVTQVHLELSKYLLSSITRYYSKPSETVFIFEQGKPNKIIGLIMPRADGHGTVALPYYLIKESRGKGYATEALSEIIKTLETRPQIERFSSQINENNKPSQQVALKTGFNCLGKKNLTKSRGSSPMTRLLTYQRPAFK